MHTFFTVVITTLVLALFLFPHQALAASCSPSRPAYGQCGTPFGPCRNGTYVPDTSHNVEVQEFSCDDGTKVYDCRDLGQVPGLCGVPGATPSPTQTPSPTPTQTPTPLPSVTPTDESSLGDMPYTCRLKTTPETVTPRHRLVTLEIKSKDLVEGHSYPVFMNLKPVGSFPNPVGFILCPVCAALTNAPVAKDLVNKIPFIGSLMKTLTSLYIPKLYTATNGTLTVENVDPYGKADASPADYFSVGKYRVDVPFFCGGMKFEVLPDLTPCSLKFLNPSNINERFNFKSTSSLGIKVSDTGTLKAVPTDPRRVVVKDTIAGDVVYNKCQTNQDLANLVNLGVFKDGRYILNVRDSCGNGILADPESGGFFDMLSNTISGESNVCTAAFIVGPHGGALGADTVGLTNNTGCRPNGTSTHVYYTCDTAVGPIDTDPVLFIKSVLGIFLSISGGIALILIIWDAYLIMSSQGNAEVIKEARKRITSSVTGLLFIIFSIVILQIIGVDILHIPGLAP